MAPGSPERSPEGVHSRSASHTRHVSHPRRQALLRRSTRGPLEENDHPDAQPDTSTPAPSAHTPSLSESASTTSLPAQYSKASSETSSLPTPRMTVAEHAANDFGFLLKPGLYHEMNNSGMPLAFRTAHFKTLENSSLAELLSSGCFCLAAQKAANTLCSETDPRDQKSIFALFYARLVCLCVLDYHYEASQEAKALQDLNGPYFRDSKTGIHYAPWELRLLAIRLHAIGNGDWRRGIINYYEMARESRWHFSRSATSAERSLWKQRLEDLGLHVSHALVEMGDIDAAVRHIRSLQSHNATENPVLRVWLTLLYLRVGDISGAMHCLDDEIRHTADSTCILTKILKALCVMSKGDYEASAAIWSDLSNEVEDGQALKVMIEQNKAVCLVYAGRITEARELLNALTQQGNVPHGVTFNLATIFELTSENSRSLKIALTQKMASHSSLGLGWEKFNADFKL